MEPFSKYSPFNLRICQIKLKLKFIIFSFKFQYSRSNTNPLAMSLLNGNATIMNALTWTIAVMVSTTVPINQMKLLIIVYIYPAPLMHFVVPMVHALRGPTNAMDIKIVWIIRMKRIFNVQQIYQSWNVHCRDIVGKHNL